MENDEIWRLSDKERLTKLETKMDRVEEGISNFRSFQSESRAHYSTVNLALGRIEERERQRKEDAEEEHAIRLSKGSVIDQWFKRIVWTTVIVVFIWTAVSGAVDLLLPVIRKELNLPATSIPAQSSVPAATENSR